jgi:hypothetical protein
MLYMFRSGHAERLPTEGSPTVNIYSTTEGELTCSCGATLSEDDRHMQCRKCRARNRWERHAAGRRRHARRDSLTSSDSSWQAEAER